MESERERKRGVLKKLSSKSPRDMRQVRDHAGKTFVARPVQRQRRSESTSASPTNRRKRSGGAEI